MSEDKIIHQGPIHYFVEEEDTWIKVQASFYENGRFEVAKRPGGKRPATPISATLSAGSKVKGPQSAVSAPDKAGFVLKTTATQFKLCASQENATLWTDHLRKWIADSSSKESPQVPAIPIGAVSDAKTSPAPKKQATSTNNLKSILKRGKRAGSRQDSTDGLTDKEPKPEPIPPAPQSPDPSPRNNGMARRPSVTNLTSWATSSPRDDGSSKKDKKSRPPVGRSPSGSDMTPTKEPKRGKTSAFFSKKGFGLVGGVVGGVGGVFAKRSDSQRPGALAPKPKKKPGNEPDGTDQPLTTLPKLNPIKYDEPATVSALSDSLSSEDKATVQIDAISRPVSMTLTLSDIPKGAKLEDHEIKRKHIVVEMLTTEKTYTNNLMICIKSYWEPLLACCQELGETEEQINKIFGPPTSLKVILGFSTSLVSQLESIVSSWSSTSKIGAVFQKRAPFLKTYKEFSNTYGECMGYYENKMKTNKLFAAKVGELRTLSGQNSWIPDILITPIQRLPRYLLLLQDLLKNTPEDHCDFLELSEAVRLMADAASFLNETMREHQKDKAEKEYISQMTEKGIPLGQLSSPTRHLLKNGLIKVQIQPLERFGKPYKETQHFVLFTDIFFHAKKDTVFTKQGGDLLKTTYNLPLILVWFEATKSNQWAILSPHETIVLPQDVGAEWAAAFKTNIEAQIAHKNKLLKSKKPPFTYQTRRAHYDFPSNQGTYRGSWNAGLRHGRGRWDLTSLIWVRGYWEKGLPHGKGQASYLSKSIYHGFWEGGVQDGQGDFTWPCGSKYTGGWLKGERSGHGKQTFSDGSYYIGSWSEGRMTGTGKYQHASGLPRYEGGWKENCFHGIGKLELPNGIVYEGYFYMGQRTGRGEQKHPNDIKLVGDFINGKLNGLGKFSRSDGSYYEGGFQGGAPHGTGYKKWADGAQYEGMWANGFRHGAGKHTSPTGVVYEGNWLQDQPHGEGEIRDPKSGTVYKGNWVNGFAEGKGEHSIPSGTYVGHFLNGKFHKSGVWTKTHEEKTYKEGPQMLSYEGEWEKGRVTGKGHIKFTNGDFHKGGFDHSIYEGKSTTTFANGTSTTSKFKSGRRIAKGTMTSLDQTFVGASNPEAPNLLAPAEGKGFSLPLAPLWPTFPMIFENDSWRANKLF